LVLLKRLTVKDNTIEFDDNERVLYMSALEKVEVRVFGS
jgi:hypothetical protein